MQNFDFNEALKAIQSGKPITGSDGVLAPLIKQLTEAALSAEIDSYLEQNPSNNRRNGYSKKRAFFRKCVTAVWVKDKVQHDHRIQS